MGKTVPDAIDHQILAVLQANGREAHASIAARVGLSRSAVQERIARMEREGVIAGYSVRVRAARPAGVQAYILVTVEGPNHGRIVSRLAGIPEIKSCESLSGEVDLILRVEADTLSDVNRVRDLVGATAGVRLTRTMLVMAPRFDRR
jgi:DNA-binding Lrp family transcriptional regulator